MVRSLPRNFAIAAATSASLLASICLAHADHGEVKAETGGVGVGRDVINSQIQIHDPPEEIERIVKSRIKLFEDLTKAQKGVIDRLKSDLGLNREQVRAALEILGAANVPPERLVAKLTEIAQQFKTLQKTAETQSEDDTKIAALKEAARKAIDAGELAKADALLADVDAEQGKAIDKLQAAMRLAALEIFSVGDGSDVMWFNRASIRDIVGAASPVQAGRAYLQKQAGRRVQTKSAAEIPHLRGWSHRRRAGRL